MIAGLLESLYLEVVFVRFPFHTKEPTRVLVLPLRKKGISVKSHLPSHQAIDIYDFLAYFLNTFLLCVCMMQNIPSHLITPAPK